MSSPSTKGELFSAVSAIPHLFMIGRDGKVVANHLGYGDRTLGELVADINHALAAPLPQD